MATDATAIQKHRYQLLAKPEEIQKWLLIDKVKLKSRIAAIKAITKIEEGFAAKEAALADTQDLAEELLYAEARMGEMLAKGSSKGTFKKGGETFLPSGIDKKQSHYAQELHRHEEIIAKVVAEAKEKGEVPVRHHVLKEIHGPHVSLNTGLSEWFTPQEYIEAARRVMGKIDVDPATTESANKQIKAKIFYTDENSGLENLWEGNVWMNPPYSQPLVKYFCDAFVRKYNSKEIKQGCVLINNVTETDYAQNILNVCSAVCFPKGRIAFLDKDGKPGAPLQGQMIIYVGPNTNIFKKEFSCFGIILTVAK